MGVIHVINKYDLNNNTWKYSSTEERFRSLAMASYKPIINSDSKHINYLIISYGVRVEDYSKDSININDKCVRVDKLIKYFSNNSNSNYILKFVFLDADAPLKEQAKKLALYIDELSFDPNVKSINMVGQSKCGAMNMYIPSNFNNPRSYEITNIYNISTPYNGTLLSSPLYFYPEVEKFIKSKFGVNKLSESIYKSLINYYESISSNSHMDYDISKNGGVPSDRLNKYDNSFIKNLLCDENINAIKQVNSFHNIITILDDDALRYAYKVGDVITIGMHFIDKYFFDGKSDGFVNVDEQHLIENYMDVDSMNISSSHNITKSENFSRVLRRINDTVDKQ